MKNLRQKEIIKKYLETIGWEYEYKIRGINTQFGFIGARGDRNVREMLADGILEGRFEGKYRQVQVKEIYRLKKQMVEKLENGSVRIVYI